VVSAGSLIFFVFFAGRGGEKKKSKTGPRIVSISSNTPDPDQKGRLDTFFASSREKRKRESMQSSKQPPLWVQEKEKRNATARLRIGEKKGEEKDGTQSIFCQSR